MKHKPLIQILNLLSVKGLGPQRVRSIISHFGVDSEIFPLSSESLCAVPGVDLKTTRAIHRHKHPNYGKRRLIGPINPEHESLHFGTMNIPNY
jgi:ERCC4-type nuclease